MINLFYYLRQLSVLRDVIKIVFLVFIRLDFFWVAPQVAVIFGVLNTIVVPIAILLAVQIAKLRERVIWINSL